MWGPTSPSERDGGPVASERHPGGPDRELPCRVVASERRRPPSHLLTRLIRSSFEPLSTSVDPALPRSSIVVTVTNDSRHHGGRTERNDHEQDPHDLRPRPRPRRRRRDRRRLARRRQLRRRTADARGGIGRGDHRRRQRRPTATTRPTRPATSRSACRTRPTATPSKRPSRVGADTAATATPRSSPRRSE